MLVSDLHVVCFGGRHENKNGWEFRRGDSREVDGIILQICDVRNVTGVSQSVDDTHVPLKKNTILTFYCCLLLCLLTTEKKSLS